MDPYIYLSLFILYENNVFEISKFTLKLIGIILDSKRICLKRSKSQYCPSPPLITIKQDKIIIKIKSIFER